MDFYSNVRSLETKLADALVEHNLLHKLKTERYPITLTVTQNQTPEAQMELFSTNDGSISSSDAVLQFTFKLDALEIRTDNRFVISDALMNKVKGLAKKIYAAYTAAYFAEQRNPEKLKLYGDTEATDADADLDTEEDTGGTAFEGFLIGDEEAEETEE